MISQIWLSAFLLVIGDYVVCTESDLICHPYVKKKAPPFFQMLRTTRTVKITRHEVKFYLFTRQNQNCFQEINIENMEKSFFNPNWSTRIIIHGWMNNVFSEVNRLIKDAYITKDNFNVIVVDWGNLAKDINYDRASRLVDEIGELISVFTNTLNHKMNVSYNDIYLIGHSLGAQIAGVTGNLSKEKFNTIFALDPAEPNFNNFDNNSRINKFSAKYVESIHTDMGLLGVKYPVGHASFFPNYGKNQRGCGFLRKCSHSRAVKYFSESINSIKGFWGIECNLMKEIINMKCKSTGVTGVMGGEPSTPKNGYYYFRTNKKKPFAKGLELNL